MTAPKTPQKISRRRFAGSATAAVGVVAASTYVKPEMQVLGVPTVYAQVSPIPSKEITVTVGTATATKTGTPATATPTSTGTPATGTPTATPTGTQAASTPTATSTPPTSEDDDDDDDDDDDPGGQSSSIPPASYPGVLSAAPPAEPPGASYPGVATASPPRCAPPVGAAQPVPPVAAARPVQTPSVLPVAGQIGADLPRLAALAGLGLVASGLGLRLRERLLGRRSDTTPPAEPQYEGEVSDTYLDDRM